jgi:hypothetical protein
MNEQVIQFQILGELRHSIFSVIYSANLTPELKDVLSKAYDLLQDEQQKIKTMVVDDDEGV